MRKMFVLATIAAFGALPAAAAVTVSSVDGTAPYGAPATFSFDAPTSAYSGTIYTNSVNSVRAQPLGSTGGYGAVGPGNDANSAVLDLSAFGAISSISFLWGSVDDFNALDVLGTAMSFSGGNMSVAPPSGDQTNPNSNRLVTLTFTGADQNAVTGLQFRSSGAAFEFDNVNVTTAAVPEPASWALMLGGFGAIGGALRTRKRVSLGLA